MKLQQEGFSPLNILKLCGCLAAINAGGEKKHLISCHKVCPTPPLGSKPSFDIKQNCSAFYFGFFSRSEHGGKVQLPWKQRWDAAWWQGSTQANPFWEGGHGKVGFAGSRATLEVPGWCWVKLSQERGCSMSRLWCANQAWEPWRRLSHVFAKPVFLRLFLCFGLVRCAQIIQRERISQIKSTFVAEAPLVLFWSPAPSLCPIPGDAAVPGSCGCRKGTLR